MKDIDNDNTEIYTKINPTNSNFKISGYIAIWKLQED